MMKKKSFIRRSVIEYRFNEFSGNRSLLEIKAKHVMEIVE